MIEPGGLKGIIPVAGLMPALVPGMVARRRGRRVGVRGGRRAPHALPGATRRSFHQLKIARK